MRTWIKRAAVDRRSSEDQRRVYDLDYFAATLGKEAGKERRNIKNERRKGPERRKHWKRVSEWSSVYVGEDTNDS